MSLLLTLLVASTPHQEPIFDCREPGRRTTVRIENGLVVYRHASRTGAIVVPLAPGSERLRRMDGLYAATLRQLRFVAEGGWSYTVYSMPASTIGDSSPISGVVVRRGLRTVADLPCRPWSDLETGMIAEPILEDSEDWNVM